MKVKEKYDRIRLKKLNIFSIHDTSVHLSCILIIIDKESITTTYIINYRPLFAFSRYITFVIHLDIRYVYIHNKSSVFRKIIDT
jgi:hypothetical protein